MVCVLDDDFVVVKSGMCEIISNKTFSVGNLGTRFGTDEDVKELKEVFEWLEFCVNVNKDLNYKDMNDLLHSYTTKDYSNCDAVICFIMSHGTDDQIYATDGRLVSSETVRSVFVQNSGLLNKPKCVFIQACRGNDKPIISQSDGHSSADQNKKKTQPQSKSDVTFEDGSELICRDQDFMMLFSSTSGKYIDLIFVLQTSLSIIIKINQMDTAFFIPLKLLV